MSEQTFTLTNFRPEAIIEDWPSGSRRVTATFTTDSNKRGQRISRVTTGKPKKSTYHDLVCLCDGSDGKTHYIGLSHGWMFVNPCTMKGSDFTVAPGDANYDEYLNQLRIAATEEARS
jgi:hypothetical protein